jgi:hypothetical protein
MTMKPAITSHGVSGAEDERRKRRDAACALSVLIGFQRLAYLLQLTQACRIDLRKVKV